MPFRLARALTCAVLLLSAPALAAAEPVPSPEIGVRVRGADRAMNQLIDEGVRRSPTFAALVRDLSRTDVVVYISMSHDLPAGIDGRLALMTATESVRYLHAQITKGLFIDDAIAIAAHELQHALEVALHPDVRTTTALASLYERIGEKSHVHNRFDTAAARQKGRRVRQELS